MNCICSIIRSHKTESKFWSYPLHARIHHHRATVPKFQTSWNNPRVRVRTRKPQSNWSCDCSLIYRIMSRNFSHDNIMHAEPCKNLQHTPHVPRDNEAKKHIHCVCVCVCVCVCACVRVRVGERERETYIYYLLRCFDVLYCILHSIRSAVQYRMLHQTTPA